MTKIGIAYKAPSILNNYGTVSMLSAFACEAKNAVKEFFSTKNSVNRIELVSPMQTSLKTSAWYIYSGALIT